MRCEGKRKNEERNEYIRKNRREVDPYEGLSDPVDYIVALHTPRKRDPLIIYKRSPRTAAELYSTLTQDQVKRLIEIAAHAKRSGDNDLAREIGLSLATLTDADLSELLTAWLERDDFWPAILFRGANAKTRDHIIRYLESWQSSHDQSLPVNHALCALAWIGDAEVHRAFSMWEKSPLPWREHLHVGPNGYAHVGGWELGRTERSDLTHKSCFAVCTSVDATPSDRAVSTFRESNGKCPWCGRTLVNMIDLDLSDTRFGFLGLSGPRLPVLTCDACSCFGDHLFAHVAADGSPTWHLKNVTPSGLPRDNVNWGTSPWQAASVTLKPRPAIQAVESSVGISASQIGGLPSWVQDSAYPKCPDCQETMKFIAQLDNGDFKGHEGVYSAFLCSSCRVTATNYQQT